jgi:hypothetical protein
MLLAFVAFWQRPPGGAVPFERSAPLEAPHPACVTVSTEARFVGFAYNHIVHVANGCTAPKSCTVATNVNPEPQAVTVPPGSRAEVVTFIGSPASAFTAEVRCSPSPRGSLRSIGSGFKASFSAAC